MDCMSKDTIFCNRIHRQKDSTHVTIECIELTFSKIGQFIQKRKALGGNMESIKPKLFAVLKDYSKEQFIKDVIAGSIRSVDFTPLLSPDSLFRF